MKRLFSNSQAGAAIAFLVALTAIEVAACSSKTATQSQDTLPVTGGSGATGPNSGGNPSDGGKRDSGASSVAMSGGLDAGRAGRSGAGGAGAGTGGAGGSSMAENMRDSGTAQVSDAGPDLSCTKDVTRMPGQDDCTAPLKPGDDRLCKMAIGGQQRQFYIYAPNSYDPCKPASLIMDCHGLTETAANHIGVGAFSSFGMNYPQGYGSGWRRAVQGDNAIVVTPQGLNNSWTPSTDVPFLNGAADAVEAIADVDKEKVYVTGISMGGQMTVATGCGDSRRWRGMAPVSMVTQSCSALARPAPFISFHATGDQLTSYSSDMTGAANVAMLNHCKVGPTADPSMVYGGTTTSQDPVCYATPVKIGSPDNSDPYGYPLVVCLSSSPVSSCVTWTQCDEGVEVAFCTVNSDTQPLGGHILYYNDTGLNLAAVAWPFFKRLWK